MRSDRLLSARTTGLILKHWEQGPDGGFAPEPYDDGGRVMTIGWGHAVRMTDRIIPPIDEARAELLLADDLRTVELFLAGLVPRDAPQCVWDALVCLTFNVGVGHLDRAPRTLAAIRSGSPLAIGRAVLQWHFQRGRSLAGLLRRRTEECALALGRDDHAILAIREQLAGLSSSTVIALKPAALLSLAAGRAVQIDTDCTPVGRIALNR